MSTSGQQKFAPPPYLILNMPLTKPRNQRNLTHKGASFRTFQYSDINGSIRVSGTVYLKMYCEEILSKEAVQDQMSSHERAWDRGLPPGVGMVHRPSPTIVTLSERMRRNRYETFGELSAQQADKIQEMSGVSRVVYTFAYAHQKRTLSVVYKN